MRNEQSAGGIVNKEGRLLLVKVRNLQGAVVWTFPKGHLEKGETALDAALREVEEETGWACRSLGGLLTVAYEFTRGGERVAKQVRWFSMEPVEKTGEPDADEILDTRWAAPAKARELLTYPSDLELIEAWARAAAQGGRP
jgi:8-oxo-dGTP pyrophosphatase MutT (NUDIX family)